MDTPQNKDVPAGQWPPTFVGVTMLFCFPLTPYHSITLSLYHSITLSLYHSVTFLTLSLKKPPDGRFSDAR